MQKITKKRVLTLLIPVFVVVIIFAIAKSCRKGGDNKYEYEGVTKGTVEKTISVTGILDMIDPARVLAKSPGMVKKVYGDYNQEVKKGQLLAILDDTQIAQALAKIGTQLEATKLELAIAKDDLEGKKSMFKDNLISEKGLERSELNYKSVLVKYKSIMMDYDNTRRTMSESRVTAPASGIIIARAIEENMPVAAGAPIFVIATNLKKMRLTISIDESDIGLIKKGQEVRFNVSAFSDETFYGKISQVRLNPVPRGGLVTYESIVICDNKNLLLKPGMTATSIIEINKRENVLRVPNQALIVSPVETSIEEKKSIVWKKSNKTVNGLPIEKVVVETGLKGDTYTEIKKNLKKGDNVLVRFMKGGKAAGK